MGVIQYYVKSYQEYANTLPVINIRLRIYNDAEIGKAYVISHDYETLRLEIRHKTKTRLVNVTHIEKFECEILKCSCLS